MAALTNRDSTVIGQYLAPSKDSARGAAEKWRNSVRRKYGVGGTQVRVFSRDVKVGGTSIQIHVVIVRISHEVLKKFDYPTYPGVQ